MKPCLSAEIDTSNNTINKMLVPWYMVWVTGDGQSLFFRIPPEVEVLAGRVHFNIISQHHHQQISFAEQLPTRSLLVNLLVKYQYYSHSFEPDFLHQGRDRAE